MKTFGEYVTCVGRCTLAAQPPRLGHEVVERCLEEIGDEVAHARGGRVDSIPARAVSSLRYPEAYA